MLKSYIVDSTCNNMRVDRWIRNTIGKIPQGFIEKSPLVNDKRIKSLKLTNTATKDYENWVRADATTFGPLNGVAMKTPK